MKRETINISPTIWLPVLAILLVGAVLGTLELAPSGDDKTRAVANDCLSDLVVKQQTGQIGRYGIVDGLGENAPLTHGVLRAICEDAWSVEGPSRSPLPFDCPSGLQLQAGSGTPYPDPDCKPHGTVVLDTPAVQTPSPINSPTPTAAGLPDTGGMP